MAGSLFSRRAMVAVVTASAVGLAVAVPGAAQHRKTTEYGAKDLRRDLEAVLATGQTGVQGAVYGPSGALYDRRGVANIRTKRPVPYDARFRMASITKTLVSVVVLQLAGERALSLDDTMDELLPGVVEGAGNDGTKITVRHLLQHTSGLHNYFVDAPFHTIDGYRRHRFDHKDPRGLVAGAMRHRPDFPAGEGWAYSNTNYILAGMVIEKVTGNDWAEEVDRRITRPLGLNRTSVPDGAAIPGPHARAYRYFPQDDRTIDSTLLHPSWAGASGGMVTTPTELGRFWRALNSGKLLQGPQLAEMRRTVPAKAWENLLPGARAGLGIFSVKLPCGRFWLNGGDLFGYFSVAGGTADGRRSFVVTSSSETGNQQTHMQAALTLAGNAMCSGK